MKAGRLRQFARQWREYGRLTPAELAGRVGVDFPASIARELGVSVEELVLVDPIELDPATAAHAQISEAITLLRAAEPQQRDAAIQALRAIPGKERIVQVNAKTSGARRLEAAVPAPHVIHLRP